MFEREAREPHFYPSLLTNSTLSYHLYSHFLYLSLPIKPLEYNEILRYFVSGSVLIMIGFIVLLRVGGSDDSDDSEKELLEEALLESPSSVSTAS